jgi:uncharacterized membrane protein YedE/YeeE
LTGYFFHHFSINKFHKHPSGGDMELDIAQKVLLSVFLIALVMGAVVNKTNFCTMGAVSDLVNIGDTGRFRSWLFAIAIALIGVIIFEAMEILTVDGARPPYRTANFSWSRYIIGGVMFGIGMTLASGCGNKTLVRIGGGNIKSVFVLIVAGIFAYLMTKTDFYGIVFHSWMNPIAIDLAKYGINSQEISTLFGAIFGIEDVSILRLVLGGIISAALLFFVFKSADFRGSFDNILGGLVVGIAVLAGWYVTGGPMGQTWQDEMEFRDVIPLGVATQSYTFINPMGETLDYLAHPAKMNFITFGVMALVGVILGSFLYSIVTRKFRFEWFSSTSDFINHMVGAALMGIGGVLAMGCTIGQGITGVSTLAIGSIMAFVSIVLGSALTMKIQYYKMVYEEDATFSKALITSMVDMKLLPGGMRRLDAI